MGIKFEYGAVKPTNAKLSPDDPDYVGPKMQVFSEDMPRQWRQLLMGFNECECDDEEVGSDSDGESMYEGKRTGWAGGSPVTGISPREEYVQMWLTCDEELYVRRFGGVLDRVEELLEKLEKRETRLVRTGATRRRVDDMLEYAVRLATGARVLKDEDAAAQVLMRIAKGSYPEDKLALADNLLCYLSKKRFSRKATAENLLCALVFGDLASSLRPLTHCTYSLALFFSPLKNMEPYSAFQSLWTSYDEYRARWGLMLPDQKCCTVCGRVPERRRDLKRCAGSCLIPRKPVYCGISCQKKHWATHKKWCSKMVKFTESDVESDQYHDTDYDDYDSDDDYDREDDYEPEEEYYDGEADDERDWYTTDEDESEEYEDYYKGLSQKRNHMQGGDQDESEEYEEEEWDITSERSDEDSSRGGSIRFVPSSLKGHPYDCSCRSFRENKKKKHLWNDYGDFNPEGFVMDIARSVVRLWSK